MRRPRSSFCLSPRPFSALAPLALSLFASACYSAGDGISPPLEHVYFPVGLALTNDSKHLVVANSDFDLQYNAGTLGVLKVDELVERFVPKSCSKDSDCKDSVERPYLGSESVCDTEPNDLNGGSPSFFCLSNASEPPCRGVKEREMNDRLTHPGRCDFIDPVKEVLFSDKVEIGAFATDAVYRPNPNGGGRVFVPVRGDATLHWADISDEGSISCGQELNGGACDDLHRAGDDPDQENTRDLRMDSEPFALDVSPRGDTVLVTNQSSGRVSLFRNEWDAGSKNAVALKFQVTNLALRPVGVAAVPEPAMLKMNLNLLAGRDLTPDEVVQYRVARAEAAASFLVTFRNVPQVDLIRSYLDEESGVEREYGARAGSVPITVNSSGVDSRGVTIDATARTAAEQDCLDRAGIPASCLADPACIQGENASRPAAVAALGTCLRSAGATALDVFVASRSPASLLVGRTSPSSDAVLSNQLPAFYDSMPMTLGPSRVVTGRVRVGDDATGEVWEPRVFATCFDSRRVFIYDPTRRRVETEVTTGRGPYALAVDEVHGLLFVGHFTDSFIGVVSIDRRFPRTYAKIVATVGEPTAPRASK